MDRPSKLARTNISKSFKIELQINERIFCQKADYILEMKRKISFDEKNQQYFAIN